MLYTGGAFFLLLGGTLLAYHLLRKQAGVLVLLVASYMFYAHALSDHLLVLVAVTLLTYVGGRGLALWRAPWLLSALLVAIVGTLVYYKYRYVLMGAGVLRGIVGGAPEPPLLDVASLIPIGISFYSFQALSYLVDVYRGEQAAERSFSRLALYLSFFPQVLAGPIERARDLLPQIQARPRPTARDVAYGIKLGLWGYFCKLAVADRLGVVVDAVYANHASASGMALLVAVYFYAFQLYFDFYGYICISLGVARLFGIRLSPNFNNPYLATSLRDFWRRWHITLMRWFRDYVYVPLGGSRRGESRRDLNVLAVFVLSGLWHGVGMNFVLWGLLHGTMYVFAARTARMRASLLNMVGLSRYPGLLRVWQTLATFHLVTLAWLPFRLDSWEQVTTVMGRILTVATGPSATEVVVPGTITFALIALVLALVLSWSPILTSVIRHTPSSRPRLARELIVVNALLIGILLSDTGRLVEFVYFRF